MPIVRFKLGKFAAILRIEKFATHTSHDGLSACDDYCWFTKQESEPFICTIELRNSPPSKAETDRQAICCTAATIAAMACRYLLGNTAPQHNVLKQRAGSTALYARSLTGYYSVNTQDQA
jgi:hypothetical protein